MNINDKSLPRKYIHVTTLNVSVSQLTDKIFNFENYYPIGKNSK